MGMRRQSGDKCTLCETLRLINDNFQEDSSSHKKIRKLLTEAEGKSKKVVDKLLELSKQNNIEWYAEHPEKEKAIRDDLKNYKVGIPTRSQMQHPRSIEKILRIVSGLIDDEEVDKIMPLIEYANNCLCRINKKIEEYNMEK